LLFTFTNFHLFFAHEARVYSLFGLLTVCAIYVFIQFIENKENRKCFWLLILLNALLFYTHYFGFFVFAIQGLSIIVISDLRKRFFWKFVLSGVGVLLLFAHHVHVPDNASTTMVIHRIAADFGLEPSDLSWLISCTPDPNCVEPGSRVRFEIKLGGLGAEAMQGI
jgi:hypothetical protein